MPDDLYDRDILGWSLAQAERLRRVAAGERVNDVDWDHVIEEVEDVGKRELRAVRSHVLKALIHALKVVRWPVHSSRRKWRNEISTLLAQARNRYERRMADDLDLDGAYAEALAAVRDMDMRTPSVPVPERIALTPEEVMARDFGADALIARIRDAPPPRA